MQNNKQYNVSLKKFNMNQIKFNKTSDSKSGPVIVLIGKRNTGKSYLVRDILYHNQDLPVGTVISGTEDVSPFYEYMIPKIFIHHEYSSNFIQNLIMRQKKITNKINSDKIQYGQSQTDGRAFAILDDCLYDDKWTRDKLMRYLFMNGRHLRIILLITMQAPLGIPPALRNNVDYTFILRNPNVNERMKLYKNYASCFPSFESFCVFMDKCTDNYECLVIDNTVQSNKFEDCVFWYKASPHNDFKLGNREYWEISKNILCDDLPNNNMNGIPQKNNKLNFNINKVS